VFKYTISLFLASFMLIARQYKCISKNEEVLLWFS